jgi:acetolactate synthase-1/2/3 large subunit
METITKEKTEKKTTKTLRVSGSEALLLSLMEEGVKTIFGYPGGAIMPVYDKLMDKEENKELIHILTRHEQGAIHAAQGFARVTGNVGVCFATSGPGATNTITGIADAFLDSTPIVCFTGQVVSNLLGTDAFQETDVVGISMPITKWNFQITKAEEIPQAVARAFYIAKSGRPGPVLIDLTKDAMINEFDFVYEKVTKIRSYIPEPVTDENELKKAAELINNAKKPLALIGQGVIHAGAEEELKEFIEKTGIPVASTLLGLSALPDDHSLHTGMLGMHGNVAPNIKTNEADLLIALGMRFDDRVTGKVSAYAPNAKKIHFEIDKAEINKIIKVDVAVLGNLKNTLPKVTALVNTNSHKEWRESFKTYDEQENKRIIQKELYPEGDKITMGEVMRHINEVSGGDAILVTDVGQHQMFACRYFNFKKTRRLVTSGGLGTMGFGLPAAMGAQVALPHKKVISVSGDGGFQMTLQELGTIAYNNLPVKMVVTNNNFLGMVRQWQELFFDKRYASTPITVPDLVVLASAYGIKGEHVYKHEELKEAMQRMWEYKGPYLLEIHIEKKGNVFPMMPAGAPVDHMIYGDENK